MARGQIRGWQKRSAGRNLVVHRHGIKSDIPFAFAEQSFASLIECISFQHNYAIPTSSLQLAILLCFGDESNVFALISLYWALSCTETKIIFSNSFARPSRDLD